MNINPLALLGTYLREVRGIRRVKGSKVSPYASASAPSDQVEISQKAQEVDHLSGMVSLEPSMRLEQVTGVAEAIAEGKYNPTEQEITESLVKATVMDHLL